MTPTVSVVIPTHNRSDLIERAVRSVLDQTFSDLECIVVDDCSTDETVSVVESIEDDRLTLRKHEENRGAATARNTGIKSASGEFIAFLDDDDKWRPEKLDKQIDLYQSTDNRVGLVYCWMDYCKNDGTIVAEYQPDLKGDVFLDVLDKQRIGNSSTLLIPADIIREVGGFDESLHRGNDGDLIRRITLNYEVEFVPEALVVAYVDHGHRRISTQDEQGVRNAIQGQKVKLRKFTEQFEDHPEKRAIIDAILAKRYIQIGKYKTALKYCLQAVQSAPLTPVVYKEIYRGGRYKVRRWWHVLRSRSVSTTN